CFTNDDALATSLRQILNHGQDRRYHHVCLGINGRLDTLQAAILLAKLAIFDDETQRRLVIAQQYEDLLASHVVTPYIEPHNQSIYAQYTIQADRRDEIAQALAKQNIPTSVHYPLPINQQPIFIENYSQKRNVNLPNSDLASQRVLSLPFHPYLET